MIIEGLQKLTLLDYPGCVACTVFLHGCNLRCPFCHNAGLVIRKSETAISVSELTAFLEKRKGLLDGVCVTGGEPLMNPDALSLLSMIKSYGYKVKLDTNGCFPEMLKKAVSEGLADYVAMDIKSSPKGYAKAVGRDNFNLAPVEESVEFLMRGNVRFEFRTTAVKGLHTMRDFCDIAEWICGDEKYFIQSYVDSGDIIGSGFSAFSKPEMNEILASVRKSVPNAETRGTD